MKPCLVGTCFAQLRIVKTAYSIGPKKHAEISDFVKLRGHVGREEGARKVTAFRSSKVSMRGGLLNLRCHIYSCPHGHAGKREGARKLIVFGTSKKENADNYLIYMATGFSLPLPIQTERRASGTILLLGRRSQKTRRLPKSVWLYFFLPSGPAEKKEGKRKLTLPRTSQLKSRPLTQSTWS